MGQKIKEKKNIKRCKYPNQGKLKRILMGTGFENAKGILSIFMNVSKITKLDQSEGGYSVSYSVGLDFWEFFLGLLLGILFGLGFDGRAVRFRCKETDVRGREQ